MTRKHTWYLVLIVLFAFIAIMAFIIFTRNRDFNGNQALKDVQYQVNLGPRTPGSQAHELEIKWIQSNLEQAGWIVELQTGRINGHQLTNIIGTKGTGKPFIILGAHFDTRLVADHDPNPAYQSLPVPGANDGASGVVILLELARKIPSAQPGTISLAFFDTEDQGDIPGWDWILGSTYFVDHLQESPDKVVIIDMVGDKDLNIYYDRNSNKALSQEIWKIAAQNGFSKNFIAQDKYWMLDDHTPFLKSGIDAIDIIDFDYPYWHTASDTVDKVSAASLKAVGQTLLKWIGTQK